MDVGAVRRRRKAAADDRGLISNRRCCRLEFRASRCKQTLGSTSNRRKSAIYSIWFLAPLRLPKPSAIMTALNMRTI
jgi:hypothetical protein